MTFFTNNQEEISEPNNISLEIWEPNNIFISIFPNKIPLTNIFVVSSLSHHQRPSNLTYFPFINDFFKPEIVDLNSQLLLPEKLIVKPPTTNLYNGINIPPNESLVRAFSAKLYWQNERLQLQGFISDSSLEGATQSDSYWCFDNLQLGIYQLRFSYNLPSEEFSFYDCHTTKICHLQGFRTANLVTPWSNLQFLKPLESDSNVVEVDGIRFQTVVLDRISTVSLRQSDSKISIPKLLVV